MTTTSKTPAAACPRCGGWTKCGGMSQHAEAVKPVMGRTGCTCHNPKLLEKILDREQLIAEINANTQ